MPETKLSPEKLRDVLLWAAQVDPPLPELFFMTAADAPLEPSIASVLEDMADQIITPLLPAEEQKLLGIPYSLKQTVVANSLTQLVSGAENIKNRPVTLHLQKPEINRLAEGLLLIQDRLGAITIRLSDIPLLEQRGLEAYRKQLTDILGIGLTRQAMGSERKLGLLNLDVLSSASSRISRCPAGTGFITISPDGEIYPCPAFYHAGKNSLGSIGVTKSSSTLEWNQKQCGICSCGQCPGCPFLESTQFSGHKNICEVHKAEKHASQDLFPRVAKSGYLFDCLRTLKTQECISKSHSEGGEGLMIDDQIHIVTFDEFIQSLKDINQIIEDLTGKSRNNHDYESIMNRWHELTEIPTSSQRSVFRRRVMEIVTQLHRLTGRVSHVGNG